MTTKDMQSAMKRVSRSPLFFVTPDRKLFETPKRSQLTIISACPVPKINCILANVLSTDRASYYSIF